MKHLRRLKPYLARVQRSLLGGLAVVALGAAAGMVSPLLIKRAIEELERGARREFILYSALAVVAFAVIRGLFTFAGRTILLAAARGVEFDLRCDLFRHLERLPARWYDRQRSGDVTSRVINDLEGVRVLVGSGIMSLASTGLTFLFSMTGMCILDLKLALIAFVPLSMVSLVTALTGPLMHRKSLAIQDQLATLSTIAQENFSGARVIKAFVQEEREIGRFREECAEYRKRNLSLARVRGLAFGGMTLFMEAAVIVTLYFGGTGIIEGTFTKGNLAAFTTYQFMLVWPMIGLGWVFHLAQRGAACMGRIAEILDEPPAANGEAPPAGPPATGRVEFRGLTFSYGDGREPALRNVSFTVEPGRRVALVGRTGSGKSTVLAILLKLYDPPRGTVFIDGVDVVDLRAGILRSRIGAVPQDIFLFSDTLRANIEFGARGELSAEDVERAARFSRIATDAVRFPDKLDQMIGERGVTLSGGQKQRLALARAIARDPALLLLDDALSSVDAHTEQEILADLRGFMKGRTSILVTHRMAPILDADAVVVLDEGRVVEVGRPDELLRRGGWFAAMCERQRLAEELGEDGATP
ncbi:MAG: ABC transporter ATP-binding protein [Planctomycetes bacterium]|nr:ABC transporter ATP-binding protein [Planctomycetota bacterium]